MTLDEREWLPECADSELVMSPSAYGKLLNRMVSTSCSEILSRGQLLFGAHREEGRTLQRGSVGYGPGCLLDLQSCC